VIAPLGTIAPVRPRPRLMPMSPAGGRHESADFDALVALALDGESTAWDELVERLNRVAWRAIAGFDLAVEDRKDAFAATFCRLYERLDTVREPAKLPGWIATTARNEVLTLLRSRRRDIPSDNLDLRLPAARPDFASDLMDTELRDALHAALTRLSPDCQELLRLLTVDPPLSYAEIGELLDMPHGSIGPTRQRCLERLRAAPELRPYLREAQQ
jgi:RNA polymerase sigma factor (sigma-70 family)